ncbi:MAG TPA: hypothetical protein VGK43_07065, partial [Solirubrobacterales bacterium]
RLDDTAVLARYRRALTDAQPEHDRLVQDAAKFSKAYALNSIDGADFAGLSEIWGPAPPEIGSLLSNVNTFFGKINSARREASFPGFDGSPQDAITGEMLNLLIRAGRRWGGSDKQDRTALLHFLMLGQASSEIFLETESRLPYRCEERFIPPDLIWWDKGAKEENRTDAQEVIRRWHYSVDEAIARFPGEENEASIRAFGQEGESGSSAASAGAQQLGGRNASVSVSAADGKSPAGGAGSRRLREVPVDDFQFIAWEQMVQWDGPDGTRQEARLEDWKALMDAIEAEAAEAGEPVPQRPTIRTFTQKTWYRARIMAASIAGEPRVLKGAEPIPGNRRLIRCLTGYPEDYLDEGNHLRTRWFGFGKVLYPLQRLTSVAIRVLMEQEARRNRAGGEMDDDAFQGDSAMEANYFRNLAIPGAYAKTKPGSDGKIRHAQPLQGTHVPAMQELFRFLSVDLVSHMLGISDMSRGTFEGDRGAKFVATMMEASVEMQTILTAAFTDYLAEGAVTMATLMLEILDAEDIDRIVGAQKPREGITHQKNPESGELEPIMTVDENTPPQMDPETGEMVPATTPLTVGVYLKQNAGEIFDHDISFGLRPSAASERMANAMLTMQHGWLKDLAGLIGNGVKERQALAEAALKASFAEGTAYADLAEQLPAIFQEQIAQQEAQQQAATEEGVVQFMQGLAQTDFDKAAAIVEQISQAVLGPQG